MPNLEAEIDIKVYALDPEYNENQDRPIYVNLDPFPGGFQMSVGEAYELIDDVLDAILDHQRGKRDDSE